MEVISMNTISNTLMMIKKRSLEALTKSRLCGALTIAIQITQKAVTSSLLSLRLRNAHSWDYT